MKRAAGLSLILLGILFNERLLGHLFASDGSIDSTPVRLAILAAELLAICAGIALFRARTITRRAVGVWAAIPLASLAVAEAALQLSDRTQGYVDDVHELRCWVENPSGNGSHRMKPNLNVRFRFGPDLEHSIDFESNSFGMRWREVPLERSGSRERIAFMGDGFAAGSSARHWQRSIAGLFEAGVDRSRYEVLNFGVFAYGPDDVELYLREEVLRFEPSTIILLFDNANDFRDAFLGLDKYDVSSGTVVFRPEILREKIPEALLGRPPYSAYALTPPDTSALNALRLHRHFGRKVVEALAGRQRPDAAELCGTYSARWCGEIGPDRRPFVVSPHFMSWTFWSMAEYSEIAMEARDEALGYLAKLHDLCRARGIRLLLVAVPFEDQIYATEPTGVDPNGVAFDIRYPQKHLEEFADRRMIPYLDLLPLLRRYAGEGVSVYPPWRDQHFGFAARQQIVGWLLDFFEESASSGAPPLQEFP